MRNIKSIGVVIAICAFSLDQITKSWALNALWPPYSQGIEVLPVLRLGLGFNTGITFGLFAEDAATAVWRLVTAKMAVVAVLAAWLFRTTVLQEVLGLSLIIGGAIGNTVDRLRLGAVVDFIDAHYRGWHWPTFNVADMAIVCGVATILISTLRAKPSRVTVQ